MAHLFEPISLRGIVLANPVAPLTPPDSAQYGSAADRHFVHFGNRAVGDAAGRRLSIQP